MYLVLYPTDKVQFFYLLVIKPGYFKVRGFWMILLWAVFDVVGILSGAAGTAYYAHLGGFLAGFLLAFFLVSVGLVRPKHPERPLPVVFGLVKAPLPRHRVARKPRASPEADALRRLADHSRRSHSREDNGGHGDE